MNWIDLVATIGTVLSIIALIPQIWKIHRRKSAQDLSWLMLSLFMHATICWLIYAISIKSFYLIINYGFSSMCEIIICVQKYVFDKKKGRGEGSV